MKNTHAIGPVLLCFLLCCTGGCASPPAARAQQAAQGAAEETEKATVEAAKAWVTIESADGSLSSLRVGERREMMSRTRPGGFVEVVDLRSGRTYSPAATPAAISSWKVDTDEQGTSALTFRQQFAGAPFRMDHGLRKTPAGVRWDVSLKLLDGQKDNRSVQVAWVLPLPRGWRFWVPNSTQVYYNDGVTPRRFAYGHTYFGEFGTMIPLVGVWGRRGGAAIFSPPDVQKVQITFDLSTQTIPAGARGPGRQFEDTPKLRIAHHYVGLRPGKELKLALCIAGAAGDWRSVLRHYVEAYPELFESIPATRKVEGMYGIRGLGGIDDDQLKAMQTAGVTFAELHGSFPEYGEYMTREALANPELEYICKPHPGQKISLAGNRRWVRKFQDAGIAPFMYFYNCHANPETIKHRWPGELMVDERGRPLIKYRGEPALHAQPDSPFGKHLIQQMDLCLKAYPELPGFFIDNYSIEMIDFAHDDGVTMIHDRPAYDLNRNHQDIGPPIFAKAHAAGKIIMVNKISTIESLRGADMVLAEGNNVASIRQYGLACIYRPLFPLGMRYGPDGVERGLQQLLLVGGTPEEGLFRKDPEAMKAYRPLTDAMIGKRLVLDPNPLDVPRPYEGQIFRIDKHAPRAGDVVVALADLSRSRKDGKLTEGVKVTVRVPEAGELKAATWLPAEKSGEKPQPARMERAGNRITVHLPPAGAAGILRLSRR